MAKKTLGDICCDRLWEMLPYAGLNADNYDDHEVAEAWDAAASAVWDQAVEACSQICFYMAAESTCANAPEMNATDAFDYAGETLRSLKRSDKTESDKGGCQADASVKGETVSASPLHSGLGADAELEIIDHPAGIAATPYLLKSETVSAPMEPLQSTAGGDAVDRRLPRHFSLHFCANGYGFLSIYSDDIPEFYISGSNDQAVTADIEPILSRILWENYGTTIAGFCRRQAGSEIEEAHRADTMPLTSGETPDTNNQDADNG